MHIATSTLLLCVAAISPLIQATDQHTRPKPRSLDAVLIEPAEPVTEPEFSILPHKLDLRHILPDTSFLKRLDIRSTASKLPFLKRLDIRQVAQQAAGANAGANTGTQPAAGVQQVAGAQQPAAGANANANAGTQQVADGDTPVVQQPAVPAAGVAAPAPAAPVAGAGGGGAPGALQPGANAQANAVTVMTVETVVGGVTKQVLSTYSQAFGGGASAPPVKTGTIGMGTLTGKIGVVKTDQAKNDGVSAREGTGVRWSIVGIVASWTAAMTLGGALLGARFI